MKADPLIVSTDVPVLRWCRRALPGVMFAFGAWAIALPIIDPQPIPWFTLTCVLSSIMFIGIGTLGYFVNQARTYVIDDDGVEYRPQWGQPCYLRWAEVERIRVRGGPTWQVEDFCFQRGSRKISLDIRRLPQNQRDCVRRTLQAVLFPHFQVGAVPVSPWIWTNSLLVHGLITAVILLVLQRVNWNLPGVLVRSFFVIEFIVFFFWWVFSVGRKLDRLLWTERRV